MRVCLAKPHSIVRRYGQTEVLWEVRTWNRSGFSKTFTIYIPVEFSEDDIRQFLARKFDADEYHLQTAFYVPDPNAAEDVPF